MNQPLVADFLRVMRVPDWPVQLEKAVKIR
jgi:hypothetical protein